MIEHGWNPPPPTDEVTDRILDDMRGYWKNDDVSGWVKDGGMQEPLERQQGRALPPAVHLASLDLSPMQVALVELAAIGLTRAEAAAALGVSVETVKSYWTIICERLQAKNATHAVAIAIRKGLLGHRGC